MPESITPASSPPMRGAAPRRRAVIRAHARSYLLWTLVALAASVIVTRIYLQLTGYPQIGGGDLHIAHAIWGGLLLYVAALLPLIFANNRVFTISAILNGIGAGLFIDEIGKFITRTNDYFYPPAAPLVYAFFLLSVLVYFSVRWRRQPDPRTELFRALEEMQDLVDGNLDAGAVQRLTARLSTAATAPDTTQARLGATLRDFVAHMGDGLESPRPPLLRRVDMLVEKWGRRIGRRTHRIAILIMLLWGSLNALLNVLVLVAMALAPGMLDQDIFSLLVSEGEVRSLTDVPWLLARLGLESTAGVLTVVAVVLLLMRREIPALQVAIFAVVLSLTTVVLLTFYLDQFGAIYGALLQFLSLMILVTYQRWYLENSPGAT